MIHFERAAWVPSTPARTHRVHIGDVDQPAGTHHWDIRERAIELATTWVEHQCAQQGAGAILITTTDERIVASPALTAFARRHLHTTAEARESNQLAAGVGPILAFRPDAETLDYAMFLARSSSLAVVEGDQFRLHGWAREVGAYDLTCPDDQVTGHDPQLSQAIDSLIFYGANPPRFERQAQHILTGLHGLDLLDRDTLVGAAAARGVSPAGLRRLATLVDTVVDRWLPQKPTRSVTV